MCVIRKDTMKLNVYKSFSAVAVIVPFFSIETRTPKKTTSASADESANDWRNYGDNWSQLAKSWSVQTHDQEDENVTLFGSKEIAHKHIKKNLTIYGAAMLTDVTVGEVLTDYGRLKAVASTFNQLDAYGCTVLKKCTVLKNTKIFGLLEAQGCTFQSALTVWSTTITLTDSTVRGDMHVKKDKGTKKQRVELKNTTVEGSVIFEKNKGTIILKGTSCIKGDVIGGKVIQG